MIRQANLSEKEALSDFAPGFPELAVLLDHAKRNPEAISYVTVSDGDVIDAVMLSFGETCFLSASENVDVDELSLYFSIRADIESISGPANLMEKLFPGRGETLHTGIYNDFSLPFYHKVAIAQSFDEFRAVHALLASCGLKTPFDEFYVTRRKLEKERIARTFIAIEDEKIVSTASTLLEGKETALLSLVATESSYRGRGLAQAVVNALASALTKEGVHSVYLNYTAENAGRAYRKAGFVPILKRKIINLR